MEDVEHVQNDDDDDDDSCDLQSQGSDLDDRDGKNGDGDDDDDVSSSEAFDQDEEDEQAREARQKMKRIAALMKSKRSSNIVLRTPKLLNTEKGSVLNQAQIDAIHATLPVRHHNKDWDCVYSSREHGISLATMYRRVAQDETDETILVVQTSNGQLFGGYASERWHATLRYYGTGESMVFTFNPGKDPYADSDDEEDGSDDDGDEENVVVLEKEVDGSSDKDNGGGSRNNSAADATVTATVTAENNETSDNTSGKQEEQATTTTMTTATTTSGQASQDESSEAIRIATGGVSMEIESSSAPASAVTVTATSTGVASASAPAAITAMTTSNSATTNTMNVETTRKKLPPHKTADHFKFFRSTRSNDYFQSSTDKYLGFGGGGGGPAFRIDSDFMYGVTHKCPTFDNDLLCDMVDDRFSIYCVELWTFHSNMPSKTNRSGSMRGHPNETRSL